MSADTEELRRELVSAQEALKTALRIGETLQERIDQALALIVDRGEYIDLEVSGVTELVKILRG